MMRINKPMFVTDNSMLMESGFCVLKGVVVMLVHGVYGTTVVKKKRYWPKYYKGDAIESCFRDKKVGGVYAVCGDMDGQNLQDTLY